MQFISHLSLHLVVYWPLTELSINKRKKKRKQVDVMKEYWQALAAVELVGTRKASVRVSLLTEGCGPQRPPVEHLLPRCERSATMVRRGSGVNIAVCPCLHSSLTHHRNIENKEWEIHIFMKKCVRSLKFVNYVSLCFRLYLYTYTRSIQQFPI